MNETPPITVLEDSPRLSGWKDIARYLGRGARTVQRWEKEHGLPVRRLAGKGGRSESVFAFAAELDEWLKSAAAIQARDSDDRNGAGDNGALEDDDVERQSPETEDTAPGVATTADAPGPGRWRRAVPLVVALGALIAVALWYIHAPRLDAPPRRVAAPVSARIEGPALVAVDAAGGDLWRYEFPYPLQQVEAVLVDGGTAPSVVTLADIDGDTAMEVLINAKPSTGSEPGSTPGLHCLNADGTLRWVYRTAREASFGGERYGGPFLPYRVFVTAAPENPAGRAVWAVSIHAQMFPALLQRLDPRSGNTSGEYWSNGYIDGVRVSQLGGRPVIMVGACNNESKGASLAALDAVSFSGSAPAVNPKYRCDDCPPGAPLDFIVFPKPGRFASIDTSSNVMRLEIGSADISVGVRHASASLPGAFAMVFYRLTPDLEPISADTGDGYSAVSQALARAGLIPVPPDAVDPVREFFPLQRWNGTAFIPVPPIGKR